MSRLQFTFVLSLGLALILVVDVGAWPKVGLPKEAPLPEGAIRRFGKAPIKAAVQEDVDTRFNRISRYDRGDRTSMVQTPDSKQLVVGQHTGRIDLWEIGTGRLVKTLQEKSADRIHALAISTDSCWLAVALTKPAIQIWDLTTGKVIRTITLAKPTDEGDVGTAERMAFSPDGKVLFTGIEIFTSSPDRGVSAWTVATGKKLWSRDGVGYNLAADPRGRWVMTSIIQEDPSKMALLDAATGKPVVGIPIEPSWETVDGGTQVNDASATLDRLITPDGTRLLSIHSDGTARVWDPLAAKEVTRMKWGQGQSSQPGGLACSPDGKWIAVREDATIQIWEIASGLRVHTIAGNNELVREMIFTRDGRGLIANTGPAPILWSLLPKKLLDVGGTADAMWDALGTEDGPTAYQLQWSLIGDPKAAVRLVVGRVKPADLVLDRARFDRLVVALDSSRFADRERAEAELTRAGILAPAAWLRQALSGKGSEEQLARLRRVLAHRDSPSPAQRRLDRAVQILELAGTPEAEAVLKDWAAGPTEASLTEQAGRSLERLRGRP